MAMSQFTSRILSSFNPQGIRDPSGVTRGFHIEPGPREKVLLEEDPALKRFKSHKKTVWRLKRVGDVLTVVVVAGCCYEIYVRTVKRNAEREASQTNQEAAR
ncbi:hypothetical protein AMTR_s00088p00136290 [Amborella trichopoda]|uniref:Succinate dehydrogenase subunit 7A, mitochondrial n=2 Tax=Amborella trichopoda TaxID=13333 RepID=W1NW84_AMBTC|nr:hypothetical protein AMTR_s00088p00136290 [Amborella trichopoda]